jgi:integrase
MNRSVSELLAAHEAWLDTDHASTTVAKYRQLLREFVEWLGDRELGDVKAAELELEYLAHRGSPATRRNHVAALRSLYNYAEKLELVDRNPMRSINGPKRREEFKGFLSAKADRAVLEACGSMQERSLVWLLRYTGLRVSEACALRWDAVDLDGGRYLVDTPALAVVKSKTDRGRRTVPLPPQLVPVLRRWRELRPEAQFVLETSRGTRMAPQFAHRLVSRVGDRVGVKIGPHALRRQYASVALNNGAPLHVVSAALGHANTAITEASYARLEQDRVAAGILAAI